MRLACAGPQLQAILLEGNGCFGSVKRRAQRKVWICRQSPMQFGRGTVEGGGTSFSSLPGETGVRVNEPRRRLRGR
jgi:hypothetical protein